MISVDYMIPADAAIEAQGKHYIHGAGWDTIAASSFPVVQPMLTVAFLLRVPWMDANVPHRVEIDVLDADGASILPNPPGPMGGPVVFGRPATVAPGNDMLVPFVFRLGNVMFPKAGDYVVIMRIEGEEVKRFPLHLVALGSQGALPGMSPK